MSDTPVEPTPANLSRLGIERTSRGAAIRAKCLECMGGSSNEVKLCASANCALWPFRLGSDPWREKREMSEDERAAAAERLRAARELRA